MTSIKLTYRALGQHKCTPDQVRFIQDNGGVPIEIARCHLNIQRRGEILVEAERVPHPALARGEQK